MPSAFLYSWYQFPQNGERTAIIGRIGNSPVELARRGDRLAIRTEVAQITLSEGTRPEVEGQFAALVRAIEQSPNPVLVARAR